MAVTDRLRLVRFAVGGQLVVLYDLADYVTTSILRDTLHFIPPAKSKHDSAIAVRFGGSRRAADIHGNGAVTADLYVTGATSDAALQNVSTLLNILESPPYDALLEFRPSGASRSVYFEVRGPADWSTDYSWIVMSARASIKVSVAFSVSPLASGEPMDIMDRFDLDTITSGDWTMDVNGQAVVVTGGVLKGNGTASVSRMRHTTRGYQYGDCSIQVKIWLSATSVTVEHLNLGWWAGASDDGITMRWGNGSMAVGKRVAGVFTSYANVATAPAGGGWYWFRVRREARNITAEYFAAEPNVGSVSPAPTTTVTGIIPIADQAVSPQGSGGIAVVMNAADLVDDFICEPFTYFTRTNTVYISSKGPMYGNAPGTADIRVGRNFTAAHSVIGGAIGWWSREACSNRIPNPSGEVYGTLGWQNGAFTGYSPVLGANAITAPTTGGPAWAFGSSATASATASFLQVVTTVAANGGARTAVPGRFQRGHTYLGYAWLKSPATAVTIILGNAANTDSSSVSSVISTPWTTYAQGVLWTPAADSDANQFTVLNPNAAIQTFGVAGATACETWTTTNSVQILTTDTTVTLTSVPPEWPTRVPFDIGVLGAASIATNIEFMRVTAITGLVLTVTRGLYGVASTSTITAASTICLVPGSSSPLTREFHGSGHLLGITSVHSFTTQSTYGSAVTQTVNALSAAGIVMRGGINVNQVYTYPIDPAIYDADPFTNTIDVEVYVRFLTDNTITGTLGVSEGSSLQYAREFGSGAAPFISLPTAGQNRWTRCGTLTLTRSTTQQTLKLSITTDNAGAGNIDLDQILVVPARNRVAMAGGKNIGITVAGLTAPLVIQSDNGSQQLTRVTSGPISAPALFGGNPIQFQADNGFVIAGFVSNIEIDTQITLVSFTNDAMPGLDLLHVAYTPRYNLARGVTT